MITCQLCNKEFKSHSGPFSLHLKTKHNIIPEQYYRQFINTNEIDYICKHCGKPNKFNGVAKGYRQTCGDSYCAHEEVKLTSLRTRGYESPNQDPLVKQNKINGCQKKHGVDNVFQSTWVKQKSKQTKKERYDDENFNNIEKQKETLKNRTPEQKQLHQDRIQETCQRKYKAKQYFSSKDFSGKSQKTMIERLGVPYAMMSHIVFSKSLRTALSTKEYIMPSGKIEYIQGYEDLAIHELLEMGYEEDDIVIQPGDDTFKIKYKSYDGKNHRYFPDIYIKSENLIIEVKSPWTYNGKKEYLKSNLLKQQACLNAGYNFEFLIYELKDIKQFRNQPSTQVS